MCIKRKWKRPVDIPACRTSPLLSPYNSSLAQTRWPDTLNSPQTKNTLSLPFSWTFCRWSLLRVELEANTNMYLKTAGIAGLPVHHTKLGRNSSPKHPGSTPPSVCSPSHISLCLTPTPPLVSLWIFQTLPFYSEFTIRQLQSDTDPQALLPGPAFTQAFN